MINDPSSGVTIPLPALPPVPPSAGIGTTGELPIDAEASGIPTSNPYATPVIVGGQDPSDSGWWTGGDGDKEVVIIEVGNAINRGEITEEQAKVFLDIYVALVEAYESFDGSPGFDFASIIEPIKALLSTNPTEAITALNGALTRITELSDRLEREREFEADEIERTWQREQRKREAALTERSVLTGERQLGLSVDRFGFEQVEAEISNRFRQAELSSIDRRAELAAFSQAAGYQTGLTRDAMSRREGLLDMILNRPGGLPYPGMGVSPSGQGYADIARRAGGVVVDPITFQGGIQKFPDVTNTPDFRRTLEIIEELKRRNIETPTVVEQK